MLSAISRTIVGTLLTSLASWSVHAELPNLSPSQPAVRSPTDFPAPNEPANSYLNSAPSTMGTDVDMYDNVAIVGTPGANSWVGNASIWIRNSSGHWNRTATLTASDAKSNARFGLSVALLKDRAVVASKNAIYLFVRQSSGAWLQKDERTFAGASTVSDVDWQGNLLVVGVRGDTYPDYAFAYDTSQTNVLRKIARFRPADAEARADAFGFHVAAYGTTAVVTAPHQSSLEGAVYVYSCGTNSCTQTQKILAPNHDNAARELFGLSADMNGTYLVIGAPEAGAEPVDEGVPHAGEVYVYTRSGNAWAQTQTLQPTSDEFVGYKNLGNDVTIQGTRLLLGAPSGNWPPADDVVFEYTLNGGVWSPRAVLHSDDPYTSFGASTSLIGQYAIVGEPDSSAATTNAGAYFFKLP